MKRIGQKRIEWVLLFIIALVCAVLSFLQYRWTGDLSRAEPALLRAGLSEQIRRLVHAFNEELRGNCTTLLPDANEITRQGTVKAHAARYAQWISSHNRNVFARIGIAVPEHGTLKLYGIDAAGQVAPLAWPADWERMRAVMTARMKGVGRPPSAPPDSSLIEIPIFANSSTPAEEIEWMIFELNDHYIRTSVLPRLVAEYMNPDGTAAYDVSIDWAGPREGVVFSTRNDGSSVASKADATGGLFSGDMGTGFVGARGRVGDGRTPPRWTIAVRHRAGSLDEAVFRARTRNLIASLLLVGLLGGTAWALVRYTARSRRLSEMQFRFATGVSHDLRTPLTAIRGAAFNLVEGVVSEPAATQRYLKLILRNAEELTSMIENVLAFSASMQMQEEERRETFAVGGLIRRAAATMTHEIEQAGCSIEVTVAPELPAVQGDLIALELVFRNLIGNAVRHGAAGKWIGVSAAACGDGIEVRVSDRGPGIQEGDSERIFEPFYRAEETRAHRVPGTGLGLSLVKNTIERHKGTVQVHNTAGGGAQFTVRLPAVPEAI